MVVAGALGITGAAFGQATITRVPHLGGGHVDVRALNNNGAVAGFSITGAGEQHAILFSGGVLQDLGTLGGLFSFGAALNDSGVVVGDSDLPDGGSQHAFAYRNGVMTDLGVLPDGQFSSASFINNAGHIAGLAAGPDGFTRGFLYRNDQMTDIGSLGSGLSTILDLNENGHAVGYSLDESFQPLAFHYDGTTMHNLGTLGGAFSRASAINDSGVIVGESDDSSGVAQAFIYRDGAMTQLPSLGGSSSVAYAINNAGQILGDSLVNGDTANHAFTIKNGAIVDLGTLGGDNSYANTVNRRGDVIGDSEDDLGFVRPFLYRNGQMVDLNSLLPENSGWVLDTAFYLNDRGQVAGYGTHNSEFAWYILTPPNVPPVANAGADQSVECSPAVRVDGSGSIDEDEDELSYEWREGDVVLGSTAVLEVTLPAGTHTLTLSVSDGRGGSDEDTVSVTVVSDTTAPTVSCAESHTVTVVDGCHAPVPDFASAAIASDNCSSLLVRAQTPAAGTSMSVGTHIVTVSVTDEAGNVGTCPVALTVIDNVAPAGDCPPAQTVAAGADGRATVPDFTSALFATDNCTDASALVKTQSPAAGTRVAAGSHVVTLTVTDAAGNSSTCATLLKVLDNLPPTITSISANPAVIQPTGGLVPFTVSVTAADNSDPTPVTKIISITSDEPTTGRGDHTSIDWHITGNLTGEVRAERSKKGDGRIYTVTVECRDSAGNTTTASTTITVPRRAD